MASEEEYAMPEQAQAVEEAVVSVEEDGEPSAEEDVGPLFAKDYEGAAPVQYLLLAQKATEISLVVPDFMGEDGSGPYVVAVLPLKALGARKGSAKGLSRPEGKESSWPLSDTRIAWRISKAYLCVHRVSLRLPFDSGRLGMYVLAHEFVTRAGEKLSWGVAEHGGGGCGPPGFAEQSAGDCKSSGNGSETESGPPRSLGRRGFYFGSSATGYSTSSRAVASWEYEESGPQRLKEPFSKRVGGNSGSSGKRRAELPSVTAPTTASHANPPQASDLAAALSQLAGVPSSRTLTDALHALLCFEMTGTAFLLCM